MSPVFLPPTDEEIAVVTAQLGRPARGVLGIAARCVCGTPTVVATRPRLDDGTPFPTLYYLSHPAATAAVSTLEATGVMPRLAETIEGEVAAAYLKAHEAYIADRESIEVVAELAGISAGGMPTRVKCLHALVGHALAAGPGVNPIGDAALALCSWSPEVCVCTSAEVPGPADVLGGPAEVSGPAEVPGPAVASGPAEESGPAVASGPARVEG